MRKVMASDTGPGSNLAGVSAMTHASVGSSDEFACRA